jgi:hypothetical protein
MHQNTKMPLLPRTLLIFALFGIILTAGCTTLFDNDDRGANVTAEEKPVPAGYHVTIAQPDEGSQRIVMDSDVYNVGEVVEFTVTNTGIVPLECSRTPPDFRLVFQTGSGRWATKMGTEGTVKGNSSFLQKGESTQVYRFVTSGFDPGRYRIISDCGPEREILVRALQAQTVTAAPTPCPVINSTNTTPWIRIDPVGNQQVARPFTISGTTNLPAGTELNYTIYSVLEKEKPLTPDGEGLFVTRVEEGSCGTNTWRVMGEIQATGDFSIGITDPDQKAHAYTRFTVTLP